MKIEIKNRWNGSIILSGEYESIKDCLEKNREANLYGANLSRADLSGANLSGVNLYEAYLSRAYLYDIKNYSESHDIFAQLIRNNLTKFTKKEQEISGRIFMLRLCWDSIAKEYKKEALKIALKLKKLGWEVYYDKLKERS